MVPPDQCFHTDDIFRFGINLGLIDQPELVFFNRIMHINFKLHLLDDLVVYFLREELVVVATDQALCVFLCRTRIINQC